MGVFIVYFQTDMAQGPEIPALSDKKNLIRHTWKLGIGGQKGKGWLGLHLQNLLQGPHDFVIIRFMRKLFYQLHILNNTMAVNNKNGAASRRRSLIRIP